ncbi:hypothetical protein KAK05_03755, partial [Candidatus Parcubacteria bacterium]|nr:hypothetical protein [Candidatus Parcubacteria bacterium]
MPNKTKNLNQNSNQRKNQKRSFKKEPFSLMTVKTLLAILLFTGMGVIIIGGGYIIGEYYKNKITKPAVWEIENFAKQKSIWKTKISKDPKIASQFQKSVEINILDDEYSVIDDEYSEFQFIKIADFSKYTHDEKLVLP